MTTFVRALVASALLATAASAEEQKPAEAKPADTKPAEPKPADAKAEPKFVFEQYALVIFKRPPSAPDLPKDELQRLQRAHLEYMRELGKQGKLVLAGPFSDQADPAFRGMCIYRTSIDEARKHASGDPLVKAGRLAYDSMTWNVEKGYVAFPKAPPQAH